jgi:hypothetical protein
MGKQKKFVEWDDSYEAREGAAAISEDRHLEDKALGNSVSPSLSQTYLSAYYKDLEQRQSSDALGKIAKLLVGLVLIGSIGGYLYYQSPLWTATTPLNSTTETPSQATNQKVSPDADPSFSQACQAEASCNPATVTDLNQLTETVNRYREKREEYYDQIEQLDEMN